MPKIKKNEEKLSIEDKEIESANGQAIKYRTLDQIIGNQKGSVILGSKNEQEYEKKIKEMNLVDIQNHCLAEYHIRPSDSRNRIIETCLKEYRRRMQGYKPMNYTPKNQISQKDLKSAKDIMSQGR